MSPLVPSMALVLVVGGIIFIFPLSGDLPLLHEFYHFFFHGVPGQEVVQFPHPTVRSSAMTVKVDMSPELVMPNTKRISDSEVSGDQEDYKWQFESFWF